ncbi:hypothetical protein [Crocosphaera watsonii]|uniref:Uncharacterized protein n=1 Tax=Crocosphaera watsonii WH 0401 TaxID=555881 RepID=T2JER3_CROWT|nr:hypothetical protein [Crocosphaera watsonii]CCQ62957.1 hypothetical protein CWATWH0401_418 [Crocosphaera watsonii WH 0401]
MDRITPDQLEKIIAEVERLSKQNEDLDRQDVEEILQTLNLSPDLLDEAINQVNRREALKREKNVIYGYCWGLFLSCLLL